MIQLRPGDVYYKEFTTCDAAGAAANTTGTPVITTSTNGGENVRI